MRGVLAEEGPKVLLLLLVVRRVPSFLYVSKSWHGNGQTVKGDCSVPLDRARGALEPWHRQPSLPSMRRRRPGGLDFVVMQVHESGNAQAAQGWNSPIGNKDLVLVVMVAGSEDISPLDSLVEVSNCATISVGVLSQEMEDTTSTSPWFVTSHMALQASRMPEPNKGRSEKARSMTHTYIVNYNNALGGVLGTSNI